ncbi:MAG: tRNA (adenosine(37)-N6)-threonylcarbamoyltransferase complex dimerization subunit type 1 TsaB [Lachnospiraceae bacterium]|nr:tRNA (adenosine(37)-N6)-threonylcarbamoyltransferase complex dimerization subunit type 1 TsaB [Candidatus Colinaster equi]
MRILGVDSSGLVASVAVVEDDVLLAEYTVNTKQTHSETLLPMLDEITHMIDLDMSQIDAIAVAAGPGSFTGLRIGGAMVKGLAEASGKPIVAIPTVDGLAYNLYGTDAMVCPIMDARRNQVYTGLYDFQKFKDIYNMNCLMEQKPMGIDELIDVINKMARDVVFLGDGVPVFYEQLEQGLKCTHTYAPAFMNRQRAATIATLALEYVAEDKIVSAADFAPEYLRLSQAEREAAEK